MQPAQQRCGWVDSAYFSGDTEPAASIPTPTQSKARRERLLQVTRYSSHVRNDTHSIVTYVVGSR